MSVLQALDVGLAFLVFAVAAWTVFAPGAFAATVGYVVYGLLLSLVWMRLFAIDVALTEAAIGSGVTGILLIGAAARLRGAEMAGDEKSLSGAARLFTAGLCILVALARGSCCCCLIKAHHWRRNRCRTCRDRSRQPGDRCSDCVPPSTPCSKRWCWFRLGRRMVAPGPVLGALRGSMERPEPTLAFSAQRRARHPGRRPHLLGRR
jgi:uncharacterized MnhB-related membrane protein